MPRLTSIISASLALLALPRASAAQVCHAPALVEAPEPERHAWVEVRAEGATADAMTTGHYEGVVLSGGWRWERAAVRVALPSYRIDSGMATTTGLGDASVDAQATILRRAAFEGGVGLGVALPTGDRDAGLGMGHAMIVPALWTRTRAGRLALDASAFVGHMLGDDPHAHHHHAALAVNPMSPVEAGATLELGADLTPRWTPSVSAAIGVPLGDDAGDPRAIVGAGLRWNVARRWHVDGEILAPVLGDPFAVRATIGLTRWL